MATTPEEKRSRARLRTAAEAATRLGISADTVIRLYDSGALAGADLSPQGKKKKMTRREHRRCLRFRDEDLETFERQRFEAEQK